MIDDEPYVVKYLDPDGDWTLRAAGDRTGARCWSCGAAASSLASPTASTSRSSGLPGRRASRCCSMRDVSEWLVPVTDEPVPLDQHLLFLDHMAALHAHFWESGLDIDVALADHSLPGALSTDAPRARRRSAPTTWCPG